MTSRTNNRTKLHRPALGRMKPLLATTAILTLALSGCTTGGSGPDAEGEAQGAGTIRTAFAAGPTTFAPYEGRSVDDYAASRMLFDTLVRRDENGTIVGDLATSWDVTPAGGTFQIRSDATCSDGTKITPTIVANSLKVFADPATGSSFTVEAFGKGQTQITADDSAGTVSIALDQPWSDMLQGLTLPVSGIVCPAGLKDPKALAAGESEGAFSGPYRLASKQPGVSYELRLRSDYTSWPEFKKPLQGSPADRIVYTVGDSGSAVANKLLTDGMDLAVMRGKDMTRFEGKKGFNTERIPAASLFIMFNERAGHPFTDPKLRKAVARALDPEAFNQAATGGLGDIYTSFAMPGVKCSNEDPSLLFTQDKAAAAKILKGKKIRITGSQAFGPNGAGNTYVAEALRELGAKVTLRNVDNSTWATEVSQKPGSWDMTVMGTINASGTMYGAMSAFVGTPTEDGGRNWAGNPNKPVTDLVAKAMAQKDETKRCATYEEIQKRLIGNAHVVPLSSLVAQITSRDGFSMRAIDGFRDDSTMRITK